MIYNDPFYGFSQKYNRYPYYYPQSGRIINGAFPHNSQSPTSKTSQFNFESVKDSSNQDTKDTQNYSSNNTILELFGIKLHFDDILLICLIFFLYNEGVQDQYLFIALVLLLLS